MVIGRRTMTLAMAAGVCFAGLPAGVATAGDGPVRACSATPYTTDPVGITRAGQWSYAFRITWCVEGGEITWAEPSVTHDEVAGTCAWVGSMEEWTRREPADGSWTAFNLSEFSCRSTAGTVPKAVNPWVILNVRVDGGYGVVQKDIAE